MSYLYLTTAHRKEALKMAGVYNGKIDSKRDDAYWDAILAMNKKYLPKDKHKKTYYKDMDIILRCIRNLDGAKNFQLSEFKCGCGGKYCNGYPEVLDAQLISNLQKIRDKFGPVTITSGLRCKKYNASLAGSSANSAHLKGKAADIAILPLTNSLSGRRQVMSYFKSLPKYHYTYCDENGSAPNMGNAVHCDVK